MRVEVWDDDLGIDDSIGFVELPLLPILSSPGVWTVNGLYDLKIPTGLDPARAAKGLGQIYLQIKFVDDPTKKDEPVPDVTDNIEAQLKEEQEKITGTLKVRVAHATKLLPVDNDSTTSDPFVQVIYAGTTVKSNHKSKTLNPIWNFTSDIKFSVLKKSPPPLTIHVFDHNAILSNNMIGIKEFDLAEVFAHPGIIL